MGVCVCLVFWTITWSACYKCLCLWSMAYSILSKSKLLAGESYCCYNIKGHLHQGHWNPNLWGHCHSLFQTKAVLQIHDLLLPGWYLGAFVESSDRPGHEDCWRRVCSKASGLNPMTFNILPLLCFCSGNIQYSRMPVSSYLMGLKLFSDQWQYPN